MYSTLTGTYSYAAPGTYHGTGGVYQTSGPMYLSGTAQSYYGQNHLANPSTSSNPFNPAFGAASSAHPGTVTAASGSGSSGGSGYSNGRTGIAPVGVMSKNSQPSYQRHGDSNYVNSSSSGGGDAGQVDPDAETRLKAETLVSSVIL